MMKPPLDHCDACGADFDRAMWARCCSTALATTRCTGTRPVGIGNVDD
jgi:hypothetical protein